jgi:hypothetical protein
VNVPTDAAVERDLRRSRRDITRMPAVGARTGVPHASPWTGHVDRGVDKRSGQVYFRGRAMVRGKRYAVIVCVPKPRPDGTGRRAKPRSEKSFQEEC